VACTVGEDNNLCPDTSIVHTTRILVKSEALRRPLGQKGEFDRVLPVVFLSRGAPGDLSSCSMGKNGY
jgi:hypothetical protein